MNSLAKDVAGLIDATPVIITEIDMNDVPVIDIITKKRDWQLGNSQEIMLKYRDEITPVGVVTSAARENQSVFTSTLWGMDKAPVGMLTKVFIGYSILFKYMDFMITTRGYSKKYDIKEGCKF